MYKTMLYSAAALGLMTQAGFANEIIINGVPHQAGGTITIPYNHGTANCCDPVVSDVQTQPVTGHAPDAAVHEHIINIKPAAVVAPTAVVAPAPVYAEPIVAEPFFSGPQVAAPFTSVWKSRVYVGARGGHSNIRDTSFNLQGGAIQNDYEETGYNISGVVGWGAKTNDYGIRLEGEVGYQTADISSHSTGAATFVAEAGGETSALYGFVNAYLDIPVADRLSGTLGGGIGIAEVDFDNHSVDLPGIGTLLDDDDTVFAYHLDAGLSYDVTDRIALEALYRYTNFTDVELTSLDGTTSETDVDSHNVLIGARYGF